MSQGGVHPSVSSQPPQRTRQYVLSASTNSPRATASPGLRSVTTLSGGASDSSFLTSFPRGHGFMAAPPCDAPRPRSINGPANSKGCNLYSSTDENLTVSKITARVSRVGVAARPPRLARLLPRRRVSMATGPFSLIQTRQAALLRLTSGPSVDSPPVPLGPHPTTANAGASNPGALCLLSSSLNLARPSRVALQGRTVEGFGSKPIEGARDHFSCPEIDLDQLAHSPVFQSAGKPGWPASVSTT